MMLVRIHELNARACLNVLAISHSKNTGNAIRSFFTVIPGEQAPQGYGRFSSVFLYAPQ